MVVPALFVLALCLAAWPGVVSAQIRAETTGTRRVTTLDTLAAYPGFYHLQPVRVRARLVTDQVGTALLHGDTRLLVVGTEGDGLSRRALASATRCVTIPMEHGVDSLNVATAAAVALWAVRSASGGAGE